MTCCGAGQVGGGADVLQAELRPAGLLLHLGGAHLVEFLDGNPGVLLAVFHPDQPSAGLEGLRQGGGHGVRVVELVVDVDHHRHVHRGRRQLGVGREDRRGLVSTFSTPSARSRTRNRAEHLRLDVHGQHGPRRNHRRCRRPPGASRWAMTPLPAPMSATVIPGSRSSRSTSVARSSSCWRVGRSSQRAPWCPITRAICRPEGSSGRCRWGPVPDPVFIERAASAGGTTSAGAAWAANRAAGGKQDVHRGSPVAGSRFADRMMDSHSPPRNFLPAIGQQHGDAVVHAVPQPGGGVAGDECVRGRVDQRRAGDRADQQVGDGLEIEGAGGRGNRPRQNPRLRRSVAKSRRSWAMPALVKQVAQHAGGDAEAVRPAVARRTARRPAGAAPAPRRSPAPPASPRGALSSGRWAARSAKTRA